MNTTSVTPPMSLDISSIEGIPNFVVPFTDKCNLCEGPLLDPFQTRCGHRLCRACLTKHHEENGDPAMCPFNEEDCENISLKNNDGSVYPDFYLLKQLKRKEVYCNYKEMGCQETMKLSKLQSHILQCDFGKVPCPNVAVGCKEKLRKEHLDEHKERCPYNPVVCSHCNSSVPASLMSAHTDVCEMVRVACPHKCGENDILRRDLPKHEEICPLKPIDCGFRKMGCNFKGSTEMVKEHEGTEHCLHLKLLCDHLVKLEAKSEDMEKQLESASTVSVGPSSLDNIEEHLKRHEQKLMRQENRIKETQKTVAKQAQTLLEVRTEGPSSLPASSLSAAANATSAGMDNQLRDTLSRMNTLETTQSTLRGVIQRLEDQARGQTAKYAEYDLRFQVLETASFNGILLWKIRDYKRRKEDAKNGGVLSLYSQAFYTSRHGYRMCARVYLNGDGMGAGTHVSMFFVVMRGEYDPLLRWPFRQKVSLMLLDQVGHVRHIQDTFRPDPSSSSFQQPRSEMNIASGCPLFVSHAVLEAKDSPYLRDDTIFIKIVCDREGIPTE